jgi:hypothetical protein
MYTMQVVWLLQVQLRMHVANSVPWVLKYTSTSTNTYVTFVSPVLLKCAVLAGTSMYGFNSANGPINRHIDTRGSVTNHASCCIYYIPCCRHVHVWFQPC